MLSWYEVNFWDHFLFSLFSSLRHSRYSSYVMVIFVRLFFLSSFLLSVISQQAETSWKSEDWKEICDKAIFRFSQYLLVKLECGEMKWSIASTTLNYEYQVKFWRLIEKLAYWYEGILFFSHFINCKYCLLCRKYKAQILHLESTRLFKW